MQRPNFITDEVKTFPINVNVFSKYSENNYDTLDNLAEQKGYYPIESESDEKIETSGLIGMQNSKLHCGWIATIGDPNRINCMHQIELLNKKIVECKSKGEEILIGFCQTGKFSVGYTIYVKRK